MKIESNATAPSEPEDGWVEAPALIDTELLSTVLCRFTGRPLDLSLGCLERAERLHPDLSCGAIYYQAQALASGRLVMEDFAAPPEQVRAPWQGGDVIGTTHVAR